MGNEPFLFLKQFNANTIVTLIANSNELRNHLHSFVLSQSCSAIQIIIVAMTLCTNNLCLQYCPALINAHRMGKEQASSLNRDVQFHCQK